MRARTALLLGVVLAGILTLALAGSTTLQAIGFAVTAAGGVLLVSLAFYAVGRSEDRARAEQTRAAERARADDKGRGAGPARHRPARRR